jgi:DNA repair exonuclease SbcCD ATPase subunit
MKLIKAEINNILSIEKAEINFGETGLVLVEGYDYDTGRANGAGKSAIFNAISFALYDKIPRRISKSEVLRKTTKEGFCCVTLGAGDRIFKVKRCRPTLVEFYIDDQKVDMTQEEFESNIKLNYDQFVLTMYNPQDASERFLTLNDADKKSFLLKIMNLNKFNDAKDIVSSKLKQLEQTNLLIKSKKDTCNSNIKIYQESIQDSQYINSNIDQINKDMQAYTKEIKQLELVNEPDLSKYAETESKIQDRLTLLASTSNSRAEEMRKYNQLQLSLRPFDPKKPDTVCPACNADLNIQGKTLAKADDIDALKKQWESHQEEIKAQMLEHKTTIDKCDLILSKKEEVKLLIEKIKLKKQEEYRDYRDAQNRISEYKNSIAIKKTQLVNFQSQLEKNEDIEEKIKDIVENLKQLNIKTQEIEDETSVLGAIDHIFDSTGAPAYIIDCIIDLINETISSDIVDIWPSASYSIKTYKENKDKTVKAKISESLVVDGAERSVGSLSGGEFRSLSLIIDFAIIQVLSSHYGIDVNPIILDEPFDGLDLAGRELLIDILTKLSNNRQIWVIDHASEAKSLFNQVLKVEKRSGISSIQSNEAH